jgi:TRAP-type mannitol/chloroaromatic compound transport system permease small subunit
MKALSGTDGLFYFVDEMVLWRFVNVSWQGFALIVKKIRIMYNLSRCAV